jgi:AbrB family looped-hinge helix DNA binding protein
MARTRLSSKGQLIIPKEVRDRHGWVAGTELEVVDRGASVELRPSTAFPPTRLEDVAGMLKPKGPTVTLADMDRAIDEAIGERWERFERQSRE